jgi:hypothetical protein
MIRQQTGMILLLTALPALAATGRIAAPTQTLAIPAVVSLLEGDVSVLVTEASPTQPVRLLDRLPAGVTLRLAQDSRVVILFADGRRFEVAGESEVSIGDREPILVNGAMRRLADVPTSPALFRIVGSEGISGDTATTRIRSDEEGRSGLDPGNGSVIEGATTTFRFNPVENARRYRVEITDEHTHETLLTVTTSASEIIVSAGILEPGTPYHWTVQAIGPLPQPALLGASFATLSAEHRTMRHALAELAEAPGNPDLWILLAEVDRVLGMRQEACADLDRAIAHGAPHPATNDTQQRLGCE